MQNVYCYSCSSCRCNTCKYNQSCYNNCNCVSDISYMNKKISFQMQSISHPQEIIQQNQAIGFDNVIYSPRNGINYWFNYKAIQIDKVGMYSIDWILAVNGADAIDSIDIALVKPDGSLVLSSSPIISQQIIGQAIIEVISPQSIIYLINKSKGSIQLADVSVQVDLKIVEI